MNTTTAGTLFAFLAVLMVGSTYAPAYGVHADDPTVAIPEGVGLCPAPTTDCYDPMTITVSEGTTVTWENLDASTPLHTISSGAISDDDAGALFDSGFIAPEDTFEYTFDEAGEYPYFCMLHPNMTGMVIVEDDHHDGEMMDGESMMAEKDMMEADDSMMTEKDTDVMTDKDDRMMEGDMMETTESSMMMDDAMYEDGMQMTLGGDVMVDVVAMGDPAEGAPLELALRFTDGEGNRMEHVNFDVLVTQGNTRVYSDSGAHDHMGSTMITTRLLATDDPVDVRVTFQGMGLPGTPLSERTGPVGEMVEFEDVPEFGTIAMVVLVAAIVSIVAVSARSQVFPRI